MPRSPLFHLSHVRNDARSLPRRPSRRGVVAAVAVLAALASPAVLLGQLASRPTESWIKTLEAPNRVARLKLEETIARLKLKPGNVVADIGAGAGTWSVPLARAVPQGKVYAVDIDQGLIDHVAARAKEAKVGNLTAVLGKFTDPNLPARDVDVAFIFDVLHHIEDRAGYLRSLASYLKPDGRIAIVDFYPERGPHRNDATLQVTKDQAKGWLAELGFKPVDDHELFADSWFVVYARDSAAR